MNIKQKLQTLVLTLVPAANLPPGHRQSHVKSFFEEVGKMHLINQENTVFILEDETVEDVDLKRFAYFNKSEDIDVVIEARIGSEHLLQIFWNFGDRQNFLSV